MIATIERITGVKWEGQGPAFLIALGHSGTHWMIGIIYVVLPFIAKDLGLSYTEVGGVITIFHVSAFIANAGSGMIVDVTGRRIAIQSIALVFGAVGFLACGFASNLTTLSTAIIVVGITNNLWHPAAISYLSLKFPENKGYALSVHSLGANFGDTLAPLIVGFLLMWMSWGAVIGIGSIPVFAIALWIFLTMSDVSTGEQKVVRFGMEKSQYGYGLKKLIKDRAILSLCLMSGLRSMTQNGLLVFIPLYFANSLGVGPFILGLGVMAMQLAGLVAGPIAGTWSDKIGRRKIVFIGLLTTSIMTIFSGFISDAILFIFTISVIGFALFAVRPVIHSWLMDLTPKNLGGSATSVLFATQSGLSALIPVGGGLIADIFGLSVVFHLLAIFILIGTVLVFLIPDSCVEERL